MFWSIQCLDKLLEKWYTKFSLIEGDWRLSLILPNMIFSNLGSFRYFYATICSTPTFLLTVPVTNDAFENVVTLLFTLKMQHQTGGSPYSITLKNLTIQWVKIFKNGPSKICGRHPLKNLKEYLKAVFCKFYLVHSWILWPKYPWKIRTDCHTFLIKCA